MSFALSDDYTLQKLSKMILYPDSYFWFLWVLFWICVLFNLAQYVARRIKLHEMVIVGGLCVLLLGVMVVAEFRMFGFQFIAYYFLFYTLGYCLHKYEAASLIQALRSKYALIILSALWAFLAWGWTMHGLPSWMPSIPHVPTSLLQYAYRGFTALVAIVLMLSIAPKALSDSSSLNKNICWIGTLSLGLYVAHLTFMGFICEEVCKHIGDTTLQVITTSILSLLFSCVVVWLISRSKFTSRWLLGKV